MQKIQSVLKNVNAMEYVPKVAQVFANNKFPTGFAVKDAAVAIAQIIGMEMTWESEPSKFSVLDSDTADAIAQSLHALLEPYLQQLMQKMTRKMLLFACSLL